jgi:hypothetical protein
MKKLLFAMFSLGLLILVGCNMPSPDATPTSPEAVFTYAAETVAAELTRVGALASATVPAPTRTNTPVPTNTALPTRTNTLVPCNLAGWVDDITVDDNTVMTAGQPFQKIWRLRNIGTCTWTSEYKAAFDHGDQLGFVAGYSQPLTSSTIPPGQTVDIIMNMNAPIAAGTYRSDWILRDPSGQSFGTSFIVIIKVNPGVVHTATVVNIPAEGGYIQSDGSLNPNPNVGDTNLNLQLEAFVSFDITGIPLNATITEVKMDLSNYDTLGNPFTSLGCLKVFEQDYGAMDASDFFSGILPPEDHAWCSTSDLGSPQPDNDFRNALQARIGTGRVRYRFQFGTSSNSDGIADVVRFGGLKLLVTYTTP